jgi:FKBP-type peptidyl-prolyl cis-trans isomerase FkpA/FKBP-type peptidyl-prolyl cis-trans isomerase FklB
MLALGVCVLLGSACFAEQPTLETEDQKLLYALGSAMSRNLAILDLTEEEFAIVTAGLTDGTLGKEAQVPLETYLPQIQGMLQARTARAAEREGLAGVELQKEATAEPGAEVLPSSVIYRELTPGTGPTPAMTDSVKVHYTGTLRDGSTFDTSKKTDDAPPASFVLGQVVGCFRDGITKMKVGGTSKLTCPPATAYGERGSPPKIRPGATIVFEVELVEIVSAPAAAPPSP